MRTKGERKIKKQYCVGYRQFYTTAFLVLFLFAIFQLVGNFSLVQYRNPKAVLEEKMTNGHRTVRMDQMENADNYVSEEQMEYLVISRDFSESGMEVSSVLETLEGMKKYHGCVRLSDTENLKVSVLPKTLRAVIICGDKEGTALSEKQRGELLNRGIHIIYTQMPSTSGIRKNHLAPLFGISRMNGRLKQKGMRFTDEIFLGSILDLEDITYTLEDVELEPSCKIYAYGLKGRNGKKVQNNEQLPPILWRNTVEKSKIFVVNGRFFEENKGYGILAAILTQIYGDFLYPVVNASVMIYDSIPYDGPANEVLLKKLYGRNSGQFQTDILLPDLVSTCKRLGIVPTFYTSSGSSVPEMEYFENSVLELRGMLLYRENAPVKPVDISKPEGRIWKNCPDIPVLVTRFQKNDSDLTKLYSIGSAFGMVVHKVDMSEIINPKSTEDNWIKVSKDYARYIAYYKEDFGAFESVTAKEASDRYMEYRLMEPHITYHADFIDVKITHRSRKASFILRTDKKVKQAEGFVFTKLCEEAYLIETEKDHIRIPMGEELENENMFDH